MLLTAFRTLLMSGFVGLILKDGETPQTARQRIVRELDAETITILKKVNQTPEGRSVIEELGERWRECGVSPPWEDLLVLGYRQRSFPCRTEKIHHS